MPSQPSKPSSERGAGLVEFAIVAFTLLMLLFAGIELDRMLFVYSNLADAAKAGVRYAITHGNNKTVGACTATDNAAIVTVVKNYLTGIDKTKVSPDFTVDVTYGNATGSPLSGGNGTGDPVTVAVKYKYDPWVAIPGLKVPLGATARGIITF